MPSFNPELLFSSGQNEDLLYLCHPGLHHFHLLLTTFLCLLHTLLSQLDNDPRQAYSHCPLLQSFPSTDQPVYLLSQNQGAQANFKTLGPETKEHYAYEAWPNCGCHQVILTRALKVQFVGFSGI